MESQFSGQSGRFAILTHDHPFFHWDLLLEVGETCWTWRLVEEGPRAEGLGPRARGEEEGRGMGEPPGSAATLTPSPSPPFSFGTGRGEPEVVSDRPPSAIRHPLANDLGPGTNDTSVPQPSTLNPQRPLAIERIANHRLLYLDYEGPVSGNRGQVTRWDSGNYLITGATEAELQVEIRGSRMTWTIRLPREIAP